jgi:hypothetical protein
MQHDVKYFNWVTTDENHRLQPFDKNTLPAFTLEMEWKEKRICRLKLINPIHRGTF